MLGTVDTSIEAACSRERIYQGDDAFLAFKAQIRQPATYNCNENLERHIMIRILRRSAGLLRTKGLISDQYWRNQCAAIQTLANGSSSHTETNANGWTWAVLGALAGLIGSTTTVAHLSSDDPLHPSQDQVSVLHRLYNSRP